MTTVREAGAGPDRAPDRLLSRPLLIRFVSVAGTSMSFYLLLAAGPLYARSAGAGTGTAGLTTTALTLFSVATYLVTPRLMARYGTRFMLAVGLLVLGLPAFALAAWDSIALIMIVCVIRGVGFAVLCVAGGAVTVSLIPRRRRGEGLALAGLVSGVPSVAALPLGVWLAGHAGCRPVFAAGGLAALAGLASVPWLPRSSRPPGRAPGRAGGTVADGVLATLRDPAQARTAAIFSATTMAVGIVVTFLPLAVRRSGADVAALALLVEPAAAIAGRWLGGRHCDHLRGRHGAVALLVPGLLAAAAGVLALSLTWVPAAVIAGAAVFGTGFGVTQNVTQNVTQTLMYDRAAEPAHGAVAAVWNLAYDGGMGLGAVGFGVLAAHAGYPAAFALTAAACPPCWPRRGAAGGGSRLRRGTRRGPLGDNSPESRGQRRASRWTSAATRPRSLASPTPAARAAPPPSLTVSTAEHRAAGAFVMTILVTAPPSGTRRGLERDEP